MIILPVGLVENVTETDHLQPGVVCVRHTNGLSRVVSHADHPGPLVLDESKCSLVSVAEQQWVISLARHARRAGAWDYQPTLAQFQSNWKPVRAL